MNKRDLEFKINKKNCEAKKVNSHCGSLYYKPKGCFVSGRFVSRDVLSCRMFCLYGCFVPMDVLSLWMFCPYGRFVPRRLCLRLFCLRTFCLRMFCPYGRFISRRFVWAPLIPSRILSARLNHVLPSTISNHQHWFMTCLGHSWALPSWSHLIQDAGP